MSIQNEFLKLNQAAYIDLYELDFSPLGSSVVYRFCADKDTDGSTVFYKGLEYTALPLQVTGMELTNRAPFPKPTMTFSNIMGTISALMAINNDFVGCRVIRHRTLVRHLEGQPEAGGDELATEVYFVERPIEETEIAVSYELINGMEQEGVLLPARLVTRRCGWRYRGPDCGYSGITMYDINNQVTNDPAKDICSHTVAGCKAHFGNYAELPYGGYPSVDIG